jgi:hypothetical protein
LKAARSSQHPNQGVSVWPHRMNRIATSTKRFPHFDYGNFRAITRGRFNRNPPAGGGSGSVLR